MNIEFQVWIFITASTGQGVRISQQVLWEKQIPALTMQPIRTRQHNLQIIQTLVYSYVKPILVVCQIKNR